MAGFFNSTAAPVAKLQKELKDIEKNQAEFRSKFPDHWNYAEIHDRAYKAVYQNPTPENVAELTRLISIRQPVQEALTTLGGIDAEQRTRLRLKLRPLCHEVADHAQSVLQARLAEITREDEKLSSELGRTVRNGDAIAAINERLHSVVGARVRLDEGEMDLAIGLLQQALDTQLV